MGMTFYNLTMEDLCDLMCGTPEEDYIDEDEVTEDAISNGEAEDSQ